MTTDRIPLARRPADPHHAAVEDRLHVTLNDLASAQRAIREALDDRDQARQERDQNAVDLQAIADTNDRLRGELAATRRTIAAQAEQLRRNHTLLARLRDLDEQRDRAWADHDSTREG